MESDGDRRGKIHAWGAGVRTATLLVASNDCDENPFEITLTGLQATALEAWRIAHFGSPYNEGTGADLNDPETDGLVNLLEFATASDPNAATGSVTTLVKNGASLELSYKRRKDAPTEVSFVREFSDSLAGGWNALGGSAVTILSDDGVIQTVRHTFSAGKSGKRFARLRVTKL
jgi:hypothetical protein